MSHRPTIALAVICKNEKHNLPVLMESVKDCFDEIHITDTGSTDGTVELINQWAAGENPANSKVFLHTFQWVNDFAAARNASIAEIKTDYFMWLDCDDSLQGREGFINWRDNVMQFGDYWLATYHYAHDRVTQKPMCSFARERVISMKFNPQWNYFVHEGCIPKPGMKSGFATTWNVWHRRTAEDIQADKARNLKMFEGRGQLDPRMKFYYGKEYFENGNSHEAYRWLKEAIDDPKLEMHDRILGMQYACYCCLGFKTQESYFTARQIAHLGLQLQGNRAEFHVIIADTYLAENKLPEALCYLWAAKNCKGVPDGSPYSGALFSYPGASGDYPTTQIAKIYFHMGEFQNAKAMCEEGMRLYPTNKEFEGILKGIEEAETKCRIPVVGEVPQVDDIVITTPPYHQAYDWDEELYKVKGMGGSETAAIEMAKHLKKLTGRPVKVFNPRASRLICESGVEYIPTTELNDYMSKNMPFVHIAWRHNIKVTNAPTYLWCHDLTTQGIELQQNFDKMLCLTPFHKRYNIGLANIPEDKIILTRNGIEPKRFEKKGEIQKNPRKVIFPSSPDRGLDRIMKVMDIARAEIPDLELHVFYGFDNLYKYGLGAFADECKKMMETRPWVKYHGFTQQDELMRHWMESAVWMYPANFIESFCITVLEAMCSGTYAITRDIGALQDTMKFANENGMGKLIDMDCETEDQMKVWAQELVSAIREERWKNVNVDPQQFSWESVAREWVTFMGLECPPVVSHPLMLSSPQTPTEF